MPRRRRSPYSSEETAHFVDHRICESRVDLELKPDTEKMRDSKAICLEYMGGLHRGAILLLRAGGWYSVKRTRIIEKMKVSPFDQSGVRRAKWTHGEQCLL